jgi:uncharacterized membrane protein
MTRRLLCFGLVASLTLNVFFLSFVGIVIQRLHQDALVTVEHFAGRGLSGPDQAVLDENLQAVRPGLAAAFANVSTAHRAVDTALRAIPPDPVALRTAMDDWRKAFNGFLQCFEDPLVKAAMGMSQQGRDMLATRGDARAHLAARLIKSQ